MIDRGTIDRIMDAARIEEVVSDFVTLRKRGVNYVGLCPFHNEKTPSFSVSPSKGLCKCFSCGKGGNSVHFIMEHEQMTYYEALKYLARKYNIEVKEREQTNEEKEAQSVRESMFIVNRFGLDYFKNILRNHADGRSIGMAYFRKRGFRDDIIEKFQLGFSTDARDGLAAEAMRKGYRKEYLVKTGLCYETDDGRVLDRFRGRVIFPVHTLSGKVVAFGGRILNTDNKKLAKYVNSPESEIYHKSNELYGIYFAKQAIVKQDCCFLVEGYTDVISMHQSGIENVVASSGTALTPAQIRLIHRFTNNITVLYDGDVAGIKASLRGIDMLLEEGMNVKVLLLPDGDDPDSFARKHNATAFREYITKNEKDFIRFKTNLLLDDAGRDPIKRAGLISDIVKSISVIPEPIVQSVYIKECSMLLHVEEKLLMSEINKLKDKQLEKEEKQQTAPGEPPEPMMPDEPMMPPPFMPTGETHEGEEFYRYERELIRLIVRYGDRVVCRDVDETGAEVDTTTIEYIDAELKNDDLDFFNPLHRTIVAEALQHVHDAGFVADRYFLGHPDPVISKLAADLISTQYQLSKYHFKSQKVVTDEDRLYELTDMLLLNFKGAFVRSELKRLARLLQDPAMMQDADKCMEVMQRYKALHSALVQISKQEGDRVLIP